MDALGWTSISTDSFKRSSTCTITELLTNNLRSHIIIKDRLLALEDSRIFSQAKNSHKQVTDSHDMEANISAWSKSLAQYQLLAKLKTRRYNKANGRYYRTQGEYVGIGSNGVCLASSKVYFVKVLGT